MQTHLSPYWMLIRWRVPAEVEQITAAPGFYFLKLEKVDSWKITTCHEVFSSFSGTFILLQPQKYSYKMLKGLMRQWHFNVPPADVTEWFIDSI